MDVNYYDFLTNLPNMTYFFEISSARKETIAKNAGKPSVLFITLHGLKAFNQKQGFSEGNHFLQAFAQLLAQHFDRENCCRLGGGHFSVIADGTNIEDKLRSLIEKCKNLTSGNEIYPHIGIYIYESDGVSINMACDHAKLACDSLEGNRSAGIAHYNQQIKHAEENYRYILENLSKAIAERWITVYYQPIVRTVNNKVCDEEALARWIDPVKGFLSPADFIPILEEEKLIYKLDLYMVERVIEKMKFLESQNIPAIPQSINLSRSDFEVCDIVEEIRTRVDLAGIPRSKISIEITESTIGSDFDFMMKQILRFKELGFPIWMDDFGSGYSSLNVLKEIPFDLIKFDMSFMRQFDQKNNGKIILAELIKMAFAIGAETVCEGVETEEQIQFLREVGCSKIQGFYYSKPIPFEDIINRINAPNSPGTENPDETKYYETIGRVNLHDLAVFSQGNEQNFNNVFNMIPMTILEIEDESIRFVRTNQSYRNFFRRFFGVAVSDRDISISSVLQSAGSSFIRVIQQVAQDGKQTFIDEALPDGSIANYFVRKLAENPVTKKLSVAVGVLMIMDAEHGTTYANIAKALASDYFRLFYVNIETDEFIEYSSVAGEDLMTSKRRDDHFYDRCIEEAAKFLYSEDLEKFYTVFSKESVLNDINKHGRFSFTCRLNQNGEIFYVNMKIMRMNQNHIVMAISNVDAQVRQKQMLEKAQQDQIIYTRLMSLAGDFIAMYIVDLKTENYTEYEATSEFETLGLAKQGEDFFVNTHKNAELTLHPDDLKAFKESFTRENILETIKKRGLFTTHYRLMLNGDEHHATTKAALVKENGEDKLIIGIRV